MSLDDELLSRVDGLGGRPWTGETYRYAAVRRDPLSGAGARLFGGRWNPKDIVATIYLATPVGTCLGELERAAASQQVDVSTMLGVSYRLHHVAVSALPVLDLSIPAALDAVGLTTDDIADEDWSACQAVGHAAWFLGLGGVLAPSAVGRGLVLAAFESQVGPGQLTVRESEPLTRERYLELSQA